VTGSSTAATPSAAATATSPAVVCRCGWASPAGALPTRCGRSDDPAWVDVDHVLVRTLAPGTPWPEPGPAPDLPFVRYRTLLGAHRIAVEGGMADGEFVDLVVRLDDAVAAVAGHGIRTAPRRVEDGLAAAIGLAPGGLVVHDETGGVAGSHKARHLFGLLLAIEVLRVPTERRLAIASCGNAALAAAVVARAADRPLDVFVPPWADPVIVAALTDLGASLTVCPRHDGDPPGDPCHLRFREHVVAGAVPFSCQGPDSGLAVDGGRTLAYELVDGALANGASIDRIAVQVGGGALASGLAQGIDDAVALDRLERRPRFHAVQTAGCAPLARAWELVAALPGDVEARLAEAAVHRRRFMWPWEDEPTSAATGILDDETYDWWQVVAGMARSGGWPVVVDEDTVAEAHHLAHAHTAIPVDPTGTAGLAGVLALRASPIDAGRPGDDERHVVLFTGAERGPGPPGPP
jgi:threonine synthase